jgi:hypothetical protein
MLLPAEPSRFVGSDDEDSDDAKLSVDQLNRNSIKRRVCLCVHLI